jgi:formylglycine-generating enzyme required for sulfatase activity
MPEEVSMTSEPEGTVSLLSILSDQPADEDQLGFRPYAQTLAEILADPGTDTPLTIGVFGGWGRGKTSLMRMVQRRLRDTESTGFPVRSVWFNAWLYSQQESLWRALISRVLSGVRGFSLDEDAQSTLRQLESRLYGAAAPGAGHLDLPPGALGENLEGAALPPLLGLELLRRQAQRDSDDQAVDRLDRLIDDLEESEADTRRDQISALDDFRRQFEEISERCIVRHGRLAIFVDDLDRCLPDRAVEVLEAIKLFLDVPGCIFLLGVARDVIEEGIRIRYRDYEAKLDGALYLEKIVQIPFSLPPIAPASVQGYVHEITAGNLPDPRCETVFAVGLEPNPRRIKRTLNIYLLLWRLAQNREDLRGAIKPVRLAKMVIIQQYHPRLFRRITEGPHLLIDLECRFREQEAWEAGLMEEGARSSPREAGSREPGPEEEEGPGTASAGPLQEFLDRGLLRALLTCTKPDEPGANFLDLTPDGVLEYIYLTRSTVEEAAAAEEEAAHALDPQMVPIPAGTFLMGTPESEVAAIEKLGLTRQYIEREVPQHEVRLETYAIGRYPVTNAEFGRFVEDGGYEKPDYWTEAGWKQKEGEGWRQPRFWKDEGWSAPSQPVVSVSWYEAMAYCRWLAARTGKPYRLPTEAEWERAARGTDGRRYPWGDDWDPERCNNGETGPGRTTPVGGYPDGDSPDGAGDMAGQVREWCSSKYGGVEAKPAFGYPYRPGDDRDEPEGEDTRIVRGGSFRDGAGWCRCSYRGRGSPGSRYHARGFRCARTL